MNVTDVEQRRNNVLEAIIRAYLDTASPVGSELISRMLRPALSPATIRHIMAELEEDGLLEHPHTSAGRVPTDRGYRYYVDTLMEASRLSDGDSQHLTEAIQPNDPGIEGLFHRVGEVLAQLSRQAAFVVAPTLKHGTIKQIELVPISVHKLLCVLVGQEAFVASHVVELQEPISKDEALSLAHFLNTELVGLPTRELLASMERRLLASSDSFYHLLKRSLAILQAALATEPEERFLIEGTVHLFEQPEVRRDPQKAHALLRQLDLQQELLTRIRADLAAGSPSGQAGMTGESPRVRIGHEVAIEGLSGFSYILRSVLVHQTVIGGVGILGPKRIDYRRMCALVDGAADLVAEVLTQWEGEG